MNFYGSVGSKLFMAVVVLNTPHWASAAAITITNASFELPVQLPGSFADGTFTGWTSVGDSGVFHPVIGSSFNSIPDGIQTGFSNSGALSQTLSDTLQSSTLYTLQVDVGERLDCCTSFGAIVQLWAGGILLATAPGISPTPGNFLTETLTYTSLASDPNAGQALKIVLDSTGNQTDFDKVRMDATVVSTAVPEPSSIALIGASCLVLLACRKPIAR